jgi:hypothetical protein
MAAESERLIAKRTAMLVRFQESRERRAQDAMMSARAAHAAAVDRRDKADQAVVQASQNRIDQLRAAYDALSKQETTGATIQSLRTKEELLTREITRMEAQLAQAELGIQRAEQFLNQATQAYNQEMMRTRRRKQLADDKRKIYRQVEGLLEETAVEEELGDRFAATNQPG